jgi:hypothetical protein
MRFLRSVRSIPGLGVSKLRQVAAGIHRSTSLLAHRTESLNDRIAKKLNLSARAFVGAEITAFLIGVGLTMTQLEEYAVAVVCWILLASIWIARALESKAADGRRRSPARRALVAGLALITCALLAALTNLRRGDRSWSNFLRASAGPTYIFLAPTHDLIDAERRAFFVRQVGPRILDNVTVALLDNKSGTAPARIEKYSQIAPGTENPLAPRYLWFKPSTPWDEDYTIRITSTGNPPVTQRMILRGTHHTLQFAVEVTLAGSPKPMLMCRDRLMPESYGLASQANEPCDKYMSVPPELETRLEPAPYAIQLPTGGLLVLRPRTLPEPQELEAQSQARHLWEYQREQMLSEITRYPGARLDILATSGESTLAYARELRDVFRLAQWRVVGPKPPPREIDEGIIDVQVSAHSGANGAPQVAAVLAGLKRAGVKHRQSCIVDPDVPDGLTVLWVGPRSPENVAPDMCAPPSIKPEADAAKPCAYITQTLQPVPFVPP